MKTNHPAWGTLTKKSKINAKNLPQTKTPRRDRDNKSTKTLKYEESSITID